MKIQVSGGHFAAAVMQGNFPESNILKEIKVLIFNVRTFLYSKEAKYCCTKLFTVTLLELSKVGHKVLGILKVEQITQNLLVLV